MSIMAEEYDSELVFLLDMFMSIYLFFNEKNKFTI